jgi:hypothetical protein
MNAPNISEALVTETGPMALVVLAGIVMAVGLARWVVDFIIESRKDQP